MGFSVIPSDKFKKEAKRLSKKYPSPKEDLAELSETLSNSQCQEHHWETTYIKSDLPSKVKEKERAVADELLPVVKDNKEVYLLTIYDKSEFENVDDKALKNIIRSLNFY
jgi:hypothetical protein